MKRARQTNRETETMGQVRFILVAITSSLLMLVAASGTAATEPDLFVATNGNDAWSGQLASPNTDLTDGPLATIVAAQKIVRRLHNEQPDRRRPIIVAIRGGTYQFQEPMQFSPEDSGTEYAPVIYEALDDERPILSGGRVITDWKRNEQGYWVADLDEVKQGKWTFTQLFVNDQRRFRPRLPKQGYYRIARQVDPSSKVAGKGHDRFGFGSGEIRADWANLHDVEVIVHSSFPR